MARTHGRPSTYNNGKCRCQACKDAIATYRAGRRAHGLDLAPKTDAAPAPSKLLKETA